MPLVSPKLLLEHIKNRDLVSIRRAKIDPLAILAIRSLIKRGKFDIAREVLDKRTFKDAIDRDWATSRQLGVTGVPTFVAEGQAVFIRLMHRPSDNAQDSITTIERLLGLWADVARDVVLVSEGGARSVRDPVLLDESAGVAGSIPRGSAATFLVATGLAAERLASNVSPELILDALVLAWPHRQAAA